MNWLTIIRRSLRFHWRAHLGVVLGTAVGSAVLVGALIVGDSVRGSLRDLALQRLGGIHYALVAGDRLVRDRLADDLTTGRGEAAPATGLAQGNAGEFKAGPFVPALLLSATADHSDGTGRANQVQLIGVDSRFAAVAGPTWRQPIPADTVLVNPALAAQLKAKPGDTVVLRLRKPSALSSEAVIAPQSDTSVALRLRVGRLVPAEELGNFNLVASQIPPFNAFVALNVLQAQAAISNRVNALVTGPISRQNNQASPGSPGDIGNFLEQRLQSVWQPADAEFELHRLSQPPVTELRSPRIFIDPAIAAAASSVSGAQAQPLITYLVNLLRCGQRSTPYSMVTASGPPLVPADLRDDEILISQWLAEDLGAGPGSAVSLTYFDPDSGARLTERTNQFRVRSVVPMELPWADRTLLPEFPGIARAETTHDWDAGFPLVHKIRPQDDAYWKQWRGTPKAFVTLAAGRQMWTNRFGEFTAIRFPMTNGEVSRLEQKILGSLKPQQIGLRFEPVREQALAAANQAQDFGGLFIGFSFFLIAAALILVGLLFQLGLETRIKEIGALLALGFRPRQVRLIYLGEGFALALAGSLIGLAAGQVYAQAMLRGLATIWRAAVGTSALAYHASLETLAVGFGAALVVSVGSLALVLRKTGRQPARELLAGNITPAFVGARNRGRTVALVFGPATLLLMGAAVASGELSNPLIFFGAGSLGLIAALGATAWLLARMEGFGSLANPERLSSPPGLGWRQSPAAFPTPTGGPKRQVTSPGQDAVAPVSPSRIVVPGLLELSLRGLSRQRKRSLATAALLACGIFLVVAVGANRLEADRHAEARSSGTGGFALLGRSTLPVVKDLNTSEGREFYGLNDTIMQNVSVVPFRVNDGDDASCLNLNRAQRPRVLGVNPELLQSRGAFTFAKTLAGVPAAVRWWLLYRRPGEQLIPAIGDEASIVWAMGKKIGDKIDYPDEHGRTLRLWLVGALANSVLQGNLVIAENEFIRLFPSQTGYRFFLIDAPANRASAVAAELTRQLSDYGLELTPAPLRLAQFNAVQNTYLSTFQMLGGLGLLLGSVGLGVVVLRNVFERRAELALLLAVGFRPRTLIQMVLREHLALLLLGVMTGTSAALLAVLPTLLAPGAARPLTVLGWVLGGILLNGLAWTWAASRLALRGNLIQALRGE
jgi:putative ABC transport system permease protein